jgi:organic radical activating enzyme
MHYPYETLTKSVERFFNCLKKPVGIVTISGGEPLLYPHLSQFVDFLQQNYSEKVKMIEIITNGTIIPDKKLTKSLESFDKVNILLDNYGEKLSPNVPEIRQILESSLIQYRLRNYTLEDSWCGGWIDVSDFSEKHREDAETAAIFRKCAFNNVYSNIYFLINGIIHMCYVTKQLLDFIEETSDESIDLLDYGITNEEVENRLVNLRERQLLSACRNCNGYLVESEHKIPAEQM